MNRILSWKIDSCTYAYIFPINNSYISNRIPEDSLLWGDIIPIISKWDCDTYYSKFQEMSKEVSEKCGVTIPWDKSYCGFADTNSVDNVNIVLLAGKDGEGYANGGNGGGSGEDGEVSDGFIEAINKELNKAKQDLINQNKMVEENVRQITAETIAEAKNTLNETNEALTNTRKELGEKLEGAVEALNKAAFDMSESGITGEKIQEALSSVNECGSWITANSGAVRDFKTDYDAAKRILGGVGTAEDASAGLFSQIGTTINAMDNTVGNVERWMVASAATIGDIATWYDVNSSAVTEASSIINASAGTITDAINFISGDGLTTKVTSIMDGRDATIKEEIMTETSAAVTNVRNVLNSLSGVVETSVTRLSGIDGELASLGSRMSAEEEKMEQWMTVSDSAMTVAQDLRETWSVESGKLSTIASLTAQVDDEGNVMYFVSGSTDSESDDIRVWKDDNGIWRDSNGVAYDEKDVIVHWSQEIGSYIQQQASSITMSVMNSSGLTAAIEAAIERGENGEEESVIKLISNKLVITGDMIANAISAKTANIGGILIGDGKIECVKTNNGLPLFLLNGDNGSLYAQNADIEGNIIATSGKIGGFTLSGNRLMASRNGNYDESVAYLNGSSTYSDSERGTIILAAGISSGRTYHKYTSSQDKEYSTIYTKKKYLISNGDESGCEVEAYEYKEDMRTYVRLENQFYFLTTKVTEQSSEDDIPITDSDGKPAFIKQYVVRKYYKQGEGSNVIEEEYEYNYEGTVSSTEAVANTRIFEDGTIISNTLVANDGYFGGEINAIGKFKGTLENVGGTLKGVTIDANLINGNIVIGNSDSIKAKSDGQLYFNIGKEPLSDNATKEYWNVDAFSWDRQNSNGTNAGQYYTDKTTIAYVPFKSGATITIPALSGSIYRYAADGKTNKTSYLWVEANVRYDGNPIEQILIRETLTAPSHDHKKARTDIIKTSKSGFTAEADGVLSVTFGYDVHLSTYSWLNADKSCAKIKFNTGGSKITVEYPKPTKGVSIASNGMRVLTVSGASVTILDDKITLLSPSKEYGLRITDNGVQIRRKSTSESEWKPL